METASLAARFAAADATLAPLDNESRSPALAYVVGWLGPAIESNAVPETVVRAFEAAAENVVERAARMAVSA